MADDDPAGDTTRDDDTDWLDDHLELYAIDALPPAEAARVEADLAALPALQRSMYDARIAETQQAVTNMAASYALTAPDALRATVLERVFSTTNSADSTRGSADGTTDPANSTGANVTDLVHRRRRQAAIAAAAAIAAVIALGAGVLIGRSTAPKPRPPGTVAEADRQVLDVLRADDAQVALARLLDDRGTILVVTSRSLNRAVTLLRDLRNPIPRSQTFQVWLVGKAAKPVSAGLIPGAGTPAPLVVEGLDASRVLAITVEPSGGSPQPTKPILAQIAL